MPSLSLMKGNQTLSSRQKQSWSLFFFIFLLWQDKVALGAVPYKEEIEDLKMQLVKIDLEKKENAKEFEKEYVCFAFIERGYSHIALLYNTTNIFAFLYFLESNL